MGLPSQPRGCRPPAWLCAVLAASSPIWAQASGGETSAELAKVIKALGESPFAAAYEAAGPDARAFAQHNLTLSNPFFEGRAPGTHGNKVAADYIEYYFRQFNLGPAFASESKAADGTAVLTPNTSFRQPFQNGSEIAVQEGGVALDMGPDGMARLREGADFTVLCISGSGVVTGPIVFVGYSIASGPDAYRTYEKDTDLSGKVAVLFRFEPMNEHGKSRWADQGWTPAASLDAKIHAAAEHHAAGIIVVNPPQCADDQSKALLTTKGTKPQGSNLTIPVVMASPEIVEKLLQAGDPTDGPRKSLLDYRKLADQGGGIIDLGNAKATLTARLSNEPIMTDNVGGILRGRGALADQYLVIGAHYDHVSYGPNGVQAKNLGQLHPGADDNGSGTSGMLVLADKLSRAYAALPETAQARSILFLAFTAEEKGLLGSKHYVDHPSLKLSQIYLMLNLDMIGRLRDAKTDHDNNGLEVQGTESAEGLYNWLKPYFDATPGVEIKHGSEVAGNSDHASFYAKKLPVLFFFTGLHPQYHTPQDTGFTINQLGAAKVIDLAYRIAMGAAQRAEQLKFTPKRGEEEKPEQPAPPESRRARFGVLAAEAAQGVDVETVYDGTSAADAGIRVGDRLTKWNGKPIGNLEQWNSLITQHKPGDEVEVTLVRDGTEMTLKVKLKAR